MLPLLKKEINSFLSSFTGYVIIIVFLSVTGLYLWIIPGDSNIPDSGYASLGQLFVIAPWIFMFLIPALTMRSFAEEKRTGTLEILLTNPLTDFHIILAKFSTAVVLLCLALFPTVISLITVYLLASPAGNIDTGGTAGSYLGLLFIGASFAAIGIFSSALTENQVIAFVLSALLCFICFTGFDSLSLLGMQGAVVELVSGLGMSRHYLSLSRGVADTRDLVYFLSVAGIFMLLTKIILETRKKRKKENIPQLAMGIILAILLNILSSFLFTRFDLTAENRFTLSPPVKKLLAGLEDKIYIKVYLEGDLPAGFRRLRNSTQEMLDEFRTYSGTLINYEFIDPAKGSDPSQTNAVYRDLAEQGLEPTSLQIRENDKNVQKIIFPGALITFRERNIPVDLLQDIAGAPPEISLNASVELLEYNLAGAIKKITTHTPPTVAFIKGHGEWDGPAMKDIETTLADFYAVQRIRIAEKLNALKGVDAIIVAGPDSVFSEKDKFVIDQFIMRGGKVLWLADGVSASIDSLMNQPAAIAPPLNTNTGDLLFRAGVRINTDLIQDVQCSSIPVPVGMIGNQPQWELKPWLFFPLVIPASQHPVVNNLNVVKCDFASSIDTLPNPLIRKIPLLVTSHYSRTVNAPVVVSLNQVNRIPEENQFNRPNIPVAVLLEGIFESLFRNRIPSAIVSDSVIGFMEKSVFTRMIVVSDGDVIRNQVRQANATPYPLGYDRYTDRQYGNKNFILNALDYLCDESGLISVRSKQFRIRLLDKARLQNEKVMWQTANLTLPLLIIIIFGVIHNYRRKRKYA